MDKMNTSEISASITSSLNSRLPTGNSYTPVGSISGYKNNQSTIMENHLKEKELDLSAGILGKFFGSGKTAVTNILGLILFLLIIFIVGYAFVYGSGSKEIITIIIPVITSIIGYIVGQKSSQ